MKCKYVTYPPLFLAHKVVKVRAMHIKQLCWPNDSMLLLRVFLMLLFRFAGRERSWERTYLRATCFLLIFFTRFPEMGKSNFRILLLAPSLAEWLFLFFLLYLSSPFSLSIFCHRMTGRLGYNETLNYVEEHNSLLYNNNNNNKREFTVFRRFSFSFRVGIIVFCVACIIGK